MASSGAISEMALDRKPGDGPAGSAAHETQIPRLLLRIVLCVILLGGVIIILTSRSRHQESFNVTGDTAGYFAWGYSLLNEGRLDPGPVLKRWDPVDFVVQREVDGRTVTVNKF